MLEIYTPVAPIRWTWVTLEGKDAADFLHRLTTVNIRDLKPGMGSKGFFLNAGGKVLAYFTLWNLGEGNYGFEFDAGIDVRWKRELFTTIDRFTFAEKMKVTEATELVSRWIFPDKTSAKELEGLRPGHTVEKDGVRLCHQSSVDFGAPWITVWGSREKVAAWMAKLPRDARKLNETDCTRMRISALRPWIDSEITDSIIPLEVGLGDAIAENKGCYPGQEVIEKIVSLGAPPRRLVGIEGSGTPPTAHARLFAGSTEIGQVTSVSVGSGGFTALALVRKTHLQPQLEIQVGPSPSDPDGGGKARITRLP